MKKLFLYILFLLVSVAVGAQNSNTLSIPDVSTPLGQAQLPVVISNTDEIVAVQFDLTLPNGITADETVTLTNRADGHTATARNMGNGIYRVVLFAQPTKPLLGQSGTVMNIPITVPENYEEGSVHELVITNAVLTDKTGANVLTQSSAGSITVSKLPDLTVKSITADKTTLNPGDHFTVSWQVENVGDIATSDGWSEQVSLIDEDGTSKLIASAFYDQPLSAKSIVSRQTEIALPKLLGISGNVRLQIRVIPNANTGESASAQGNNMQMGNSTIYINKVLILEFSKTIIEESTDTRVMAKLNRSGSWLAAETFNITATADSRIAIPATVTIPAGQSGTIFYIELKDDDILQDNDSTMITLSVTGNDYPAANQKLPIVDNELPTLSVSSSKTDITEGETFQLTITASRVSANPIAVALNSEISKRFSFPSQVEIPAGETSVTVDVQAVDDEIPSSDLSNAFTVSAPRHQSAQVLVVLHDNDLPVLELTLTPNKVSESAGVVSVAGKLKRTTNKNSKITVKLSDDANGGLYFGNRTLELAKGIEEVHFNFGPVDNAEVDGDRTYTITAAVWLSSCSCSAAGESAGSVTAQLQVFDDDGPALQLTSSLSTVKEGEKTMLTITRNTATDNDLLVTLSSDYDDNLTYNHTVTIPAGQKSVEVEVTSAKNDVSGDTHTVVFTVQADGYNKGTCYIMVTDQTLPDAVIERIEILDSNIEAGGIATISVTLANHGSAELPSLATIDLYLKDSKSPFSTISSQEIISPGETIVVTDKVTMPNAVGEFLFYGIVNNSRNIKELLYTNNTSNDVDINILSPYNAVVKCEKGTYLPGETVVLTGFVEGKVKANSEVEIYLINEGVRQSLIAYTDDIGRFTSSYIPHERQMGHFVVGACYPNSGQTIEQGTFDYIGLRRTSQKYVTCDVIVGTPYQGTIQIENPTKLIQHNIQAIDIETPENCKINVSPVEMIAPGAKYELNYTIQGNFPSEQSEWKSIKFRIVSDEGASTEIVLYSYCRLPQAQLALDITQLNTTITKGVSREYPISITNNGAGESGNISLSIPHVLQGLSVTTIPSLKPSETTTFMLHISTTEEMQLNVPITGMIGINCENGNGIGLPFSLLPVSETKGNLVVDVCDEYTYYTAEAPHVRGAKVTLKHPYSDDIIAEGVTDDDGMFTAELPEGYYAISITAEKHESYHNNMLIDPGRETRKVVNLSYEAIKVEWKVEETEVEDEYNIKTTLIYETNVPEPVVVTKLPDYIPVDSMAPGESRIYYATLTNKGLIAAESVQLLMPEVEHLTFESLIEFPIKLLPEQSVLVPFKVTLSDNVIATDEYNSRSKKVSRRANKWKIDCEIYPKTLWVWICGKDFKKKWYNTKLPLGFGIDCRVKSIERQEGETEEGGIPNGTGGFLWIRGSGGGSGKPVVTNDRECKTCLEAFKDAIVDGLDEAIANALPTCWAGTARCVINNDMNGGGKVDEEVLNCAGDGLKCYTLNKICLLFTEAGPEAPIICSAAISALQYLTRLLSWPKDCMGFEFRKEVKGLNNFMKKRAKAEALPSFIMSMEDKNDAIIRQIDGIVGFYREIFGDDSWLKIESEELIPLLDAIYTTGHSCDIKDMFMLKPKGIGDELFMQFIHRINNSFFDGNHEDGGHIDSNKILNFLKAVIVEDEYASKRGFASCAEMWLSEYKVFQEQLNKKSNSVCASVTLQIDQTMTMTRPAYRGTLTVYNGNEETAMTDVRLNLVVKDEDGNTSHEFQINAENLEGFEGEMSLPGNWTLDAKQTGKATILFIPTKYAAPTTDKVYSFGGTLTYIDPFTGLEVTRSLIPVSLTMKPLPDLELTYFMQRDVYGDDPLTTDVVEPMQPAEFALIINNKGYGDAKNVRMLTEQPKIIDNEKGLLIDFNIKSSQVNGDTANLSFGQTIANSFGDIPAHSRAYAQWWLESSLLGHFTSYDVEATHITNYGNENLSLLDTVTIHEMIHGFTLKRQEGNDLRGFLVNDITDAEDMPDQVYFTDATQQDVVVTTDLNINKRSETEYVLSVNASQPGWNYGSRLDPTNGRHKLVSVVRQSDGQTIPVDNVWQTDRTLRDGKDWLYENRLHFVGEINNGSETYLLTFEPKPDIELAVEIYAGVPAENTVLKEQLTEITVKFNKPIVESSFSTDDITLICQGEHQDVTKIGIAKVSDIEYRLTLNEVTLADGYYVLTVQTAGITDTEGFIGSTGKQVTWIQYVDGKVALTLAASPAEGGSVTPGSGRFDYDSDIKLKAIPTEGYDFTRWMLGEETVSTDADFTYHLIGNTSLTAQFALKHYHVNIDYDSAQGVVEGAASGIYDYGTLLELIAKPYDGYVFDVWNINGEKTGNESKYTVTVNDNMDINALFKEDVTTDMVSLADEKLKVRISPLPIGNWMCLTGNFHEIRQVDVYDMSGIKRISKSHVQTDEGIYTGNLRTGVYFIVISTDRGISRTKVIKR